MFLPAYQGCNSETVYLCSVVTETPNRPGELYLQFFIAWPFVFGLVMAVGTIYLCRSRQPNKAKWLWWSFAVLIFGNLILSLIVLMFAEHSQESWDNEDYLFLLRWLGPTILLPILLLVTYRCCANWFNAAMWMQLALAITATVSVSFAIPAIVLAKGFLIGGKLAVMCSVFLIVTTVVQHFDGARALTRSRDESPLQLSLRSMFVLMPLASIALAWTATYFLIDLDGREQTIGESSNATTLEEQP